MHVAVVGAGAVGVACAHALLDEGHSVTLLDAGFDHAPSVGNAGWIAHLGVMPLGSPKTWRQIPRWLVDPLGPLAIRPAYLPALAPWLLRFCAASRPGRIRSAMQAITALNRLALPAWEQRLAGLGLAHHLRRRGFIKLWPDARTREAERPVAEWQRAHQMRVEFLDPAELAALEPALAGSPAGAAFYPDGCHVSDPRVLVGALRDAAVARGAVPLPHPVAAIEPGAEAVTLRGAGGETFAADRVVVAAGAWSARLARTLGDRIPLDTERGYNVTLPPGRLGLSRPVDYEGHGFVTTPLDTGDRVGGAVEFAGLRAAPNFARVDAMLARLRKILPQADVSGGERWMGFRPSLPDSLPVIGPSPRQGRVVYAFGHAHHGLTQSAVTGRLVADLVAGRESPIDLAPFRAERF